MLTTLALSLMPALQGAAALHPSDAGVYFELPDIQKFAEAWQETALPAMLDDRQLAQALTIVGAPKPLNLNALVDQLPEDLKQQLVPFLRGIKSASFSLQVDLEELQAVVQEAVVVYQVETELQTLKWNVLAAVDSNGQFPKSLIGFGDDAGVPLDPFGHPFVYSTDGESCELLCLGSDGVPGGEGLAADWDSSAQFPQYLVAQLDRIAGLEVVLEWNSVLVAHGAEAWAEQLEAAITNELPSVTVTDLGGEEGFTSKSFSIAGDSLGVTGVREPIEFSLLTDKQRTILTLGQIRGADVARRRAVFDAGDVHPSSLAADEVFQRSLKRVHRDEGSVFWRGFVKGFGVTSDDDDVGEALGKIATLAGLMGFNGGAWETRVTNGVYITDAFELGQPIAGDLNTVIQWIPDDAVLVSATKVDPLAMWDFLDGVVTVNGEDGLSMLVSESGIDIKKELLTNLGSEQAYWFNPISGLAPPSIFGIAPVKDGAAVMAALDELADVVAGLDPDFRVSRRPYKGVNYTTLDVGIPIGFRPSFAVIDDLLWASNSSTLLKRFIRQQAKGDLKPRGAHPIFDSVKDEQGLVSASLESVFFADVGSMLSAYYGAGRTFAGMIPSDVGIPDGLIESLPQAAFFQQHIHTSSSWTEFKDNSLVTHKEGAFGPEPVLAMLSAGVLATVVIPRKFVTPEIASSIEAAPEVALEVDSKTQSGLTSLEVGLLVYSIENGEYPRALDSLLERTKAYPQGYIEQTSLPVDNWGQPFRYKRLSADAFSLYSLGPDGIDQSGTGDDLSSN